MYYFITKEIKKASIDVFPCISLYLGFIFYILYFNFIMLFCPPNYHHPCNNFNHNWRSYGLKLFYPPSSSNKQLSNSVNSVSLTFIGNNFILMLLQIIGVTIILAAVIAYKYYFKPKAEIQRYTTLVKSLGYTVYVYPFSFLGLSVVDAFVRDAKVHKDAMYL